MNNVDPWTTLAEALRKSTHMPTLIWGDGLELLDAEYREDPAFSFFTTDVISAAVVAQGDLGRRVPEPTQATRVVLRMPAAKEQLVMMLDWARHAMGDGRECWVFGHKEEGIRSAARLLEEWGTEPTPLRIKRRTRVLSTNLHRSAGATFGLEPYETTFSAPDSKLNYVSFPGIFSHGRVDEGSQHLMNYLKTETRAKRVYDLGCGYGVIGIFLADRWGKSRITLGDRSIAAVLCAERNCAAADLENVTLEAVAAQDVTRTQGYDLVVSNPPFHQGKETRTDLMDEFAAAARRLLKGSGRFLAVANSHLPYRRPLEENFKNVDIVWEDSRYRIWQAQGMVSKRAR